MLLMLPLQIEDLDTIVELEKQLYAKSWTKEDLTYELNENPYAYYMKMVNTENDEIIGYIGFWIKFEFAEITKVSIAKKYQGRKLSHILMEDMEKRVRLAKCENITLEVRVSNQKAIGLYKSSGFKVAAIRKHYYENGEDAYLMLKELSYDNTSD